MLTFPVNVTTILQIMKPKNTIGIVSLAVKPSDITLATISYDDAIDGGGTYALTVAASGGANMSLVQ